VPGLQYPVGEDVGLPVGVEDGFAECVMTIDIALETKEAEPDLVVSRDSPPPPPPPPPPTVDVSDGALCMLVESEVANCGDDSVVVTAARRLDVVS